MEWLRHASWGTVYGMQRELDVGTNRSRNTTTIHFRSVALAAGILHHHPRGARCVRTVYVPDQAVHLFATHGSVLSPNAVVSRLGATRAGLNPASCLRVVCAPDCLGGQIPSQHFFKMRRSTLASHSHRWPVPPRRCR